jgi:CheY-like chemotaxis protein
MGEKRNAFPTPATRLLAGAPPLRMSAATTPGGFEEMTTERQGRKTILIVEDDGATRESLGLILGTQGYGVLGAANGQEALGLLRSGPYPDLILLDLMMPVMDGWQFRREQDRDAALAAIPVVVLSADGSVQQKAAALRATGYLQKPVEVESLLEAIRRYV